VSLIHAREPAIDVPRCPGKVKGHRYGSCSNRAVVNGLATFAEPFEQDVSAKRDADEQEWRGGVDGKQPSGDSIDVGSVAGMIESWAAIRLAAAATEQQQVSGPPTPYGLEKQPARVMRARSSLETVQDDQVWPSSRGIETNEIDKVPIIGLPAFDPRLERWGAAEEATPNRSGVWARKPPCGRIGAHYH
jgi:hypothetical protein